MKLQPQMWTNTVTQIFYLSFSWFSSRLYCTTIAEKKKKQQKNLNFPLSNSAARIRRHKQCFWRKTGICVMATSVYCQPHMENEKASIIIFLFLCHLLQEEEECPSALFSLCWRVKKKPMRELWDLLQSATVHLRSHEVTVCTCTASHHSVLSEMTKCQREMHQRSSQSTGLCFLSQSGMYRPASCCDVRSDSHKSLPATLCSVETGSGRFSLHTLTQPPTHTHTAGSRAERWLDLTLRFISRCGLGHIPCGWFPDRSATPALYNHSWEAALNIYVYQKRTFI